MLHDTGIKSITNYDTGIGIDWYLLHRYRIRETLKTQMDDRKKLKETRWDESINESIMMSQRDNRDRMEDAAKKREKYQYLIAYTKANKEVRY